MTTEYQRLRQSQTTGNMVECPACDGIYNAYNVCPFCAEAAAEERTMPQRLDTQIDLELDRLGWSSDTAPEGNTTLDCWNTPTTPQDGIVTLHDTQEVTPFHGQPLLETLRTLPDDIDWDDLWHAILPHVAE